MGLVLSALANLTAQWLPNWNRGLDRIQRSEQIGIALQRMADDLAAAQSVPVSRGDKSPPLFAGSEQSVTFVRTALGPNAGLGLDVVHLGETTDQGRARDGSLANVIPSIAARSVAFRSAAFRRARGAVACAVPAVLCLCGRGQCVEKQLAGFRQAAGQDQADRARRLKRARSRDFDGDVHSRSVFRARRLQAAGRTVRRQ